MKIKDEVLIRVEDSDIKDGIYFIPDNVEIIGRGAFVLRKSLKTIMIPNSVTSIEKCAFLCCDGLTSVLISDNVTIIGSLTFASCENLTNVTIGNGVKNIEDGVFLWCKNLKTIYYKGTADDWSKITIDLDNDNLTSATRYYYSETQPTTEGNFWHYVDGIPTVWGMDYKNQCDCKRLFKRGIDYMVEALQAIGQLCNKNIESNIEEE